MMVKATTRNQSEQLRWFVLLQGVVATIIGLSILIAPTMTLFIFVLIFGGYWFVRGIATLLSLFVDRTDFGWKLFVGIFGVLAGLLAVFSPMAVGTTFFLFIIYFVGVQALLTGGSEVYYGFKDRSWGIVILGFLSFLLGLALIVHPLVGITVLSLYLGVVALVGGIFTIIATLLPMRSQQPAIGEPI
jgi:uncharacterized membrane protein HdeD (DUF308 family)